MTHLLPSKSSTLKQKRLIKKYRDRSLRLLEKINPSEKRGVYHQSEAAIAAFFNRLEKVAVSAETFAYWVVRQVL